MNTCRAPLKALEHPPFQIIIDAVAVVFDYDFNFTIKKLNLDIYAYTFT